MNAWISCWFLSLEKWEILQIWLSIILRIFSTSWIISRILTVLTQNCNFWKNKHNLTHFIHSRKWFLRKLYWFSKNWNSLKMSSMYIMHWERSSEFSMPVCSNEGLRLEARIDSNAMLISSTKINDVELVSWNIQVNCSCSMSEMIKARIYWSFEWMLTEK